MKREKRMDGENPYLPLAAIYLTPADPGQMVWPATGVTSMRIYMANIQHSLRGCHHMYHVAVHLVFAEATNLANDVRLGTVHQTDTFAA